MDINRRGFLTGSAAVLAAAGMSKVASAGDVKKVIQGFDELDAGKMGYDWQPYSDRKVKVGIAGEGVCTFGSQFGFQYCPNVEIVACAELFPDRLKNLHERLTTKWNEGKFKDYPSCEAMIEDAKSTGLEAVYIATDAPSHARLAIMALDHGLHVVTAVPAFLGEEQLELVPKIIAAQKRSGKLYMMNETSAFRANHYFQRKLYEAGYLGDVVYTEGEYYHPHEGTIIPDRPDHDYFSYKGWRWGMPPMYYPTHSNAYYTLVTGKRFTRVSCSGVKSLQPQYRVDNNPYHNPFGSECAMFDCEDGSRARMNVFWDIPAHGDESGRVWGNKGCAMSNLTYKGWFDKEFMDDVKRFLKPGHLWGIEGSSSFGGHGGSHYFLTDDFIHGILDPKHHVVCNIRASLNTTIGGVYAHMSAMKDGESLKIPDAFEI